MSDENYDGKAVLEALTANILNTRFEDIDQATIANTKYRILDMIGCAIGGASIPDIVALVGLFREWGGKKEATVLGHGVKAPVHDVAFINCLMGRSFDRGPLGTRYGNRSWATHTSETTVLSALALGESRSIDGKELLTALIVGDDFAARIAGSGGGGLSGSGPGLGPSGKEMSFGAGIEIWGTVTTMGKPAIAGRLLGLNNFQMKNAFGIAVNLICGGC